MNLNQRNTQGNGLGLFLSLQLSKYLNGDIIIESEPKRGTTVKIYLLVELDMYSNHASLQNSH